MATTAKPPRRSHLKSQFEPVPIVNEPLHLVLLRRLRKYAVENRVAFIEAENGKSHSYQKVMNATLSLNTFLAARGFGHKDVAGCVMLNCWQYSVAFIATLSRGGCLSSASPLFTTDELARQFENSSTSVVFCMDYSLQHVLDAKAKCPNIHTVIIVDEPQTTTPDGVYKLRDICEKYSPKKCKIFFNIDVENDLASMPYSSGTTGAPKGVMLSHRAMATSISLTSMHLHRQVYTKIDPNFDYAKERAISLLPFYHVYGFGFMIMALYMGQASVIIRKYHSDLLLHTIQEYKPKMVTLVPPILVFLSKNPDLTKYDLSSLKVIMTGAAPAGLDLIEAVKRKIPSIKQISQVYGMTEQTMGSHIAVYGCDVPDSVGMLVSNYEEKVVDEKGQILPEGRVGEICVKTPSLMTGYFKRPKETAEAIDADGFLHTGDLGYIKDGLTYVVDRLKELIKVKGMQVAPAELEDIILSNHRVKDCAVIGIPHPIHGEVPKAFVVKAANDLTKAEIISLVNSKTAAYKHLTGGVEFINEIPRSPSGKTLRRHLRELKAKI